MDMKYEEFLNRLSKVSKPKKKKKKGYSRVVLGTPTLSQMPRVLQQQVEGYFYQYLLTSYDDRIYSPVFSDRQRGVVGAFGRALSLSTPMVDERKVRHLPHVALDVFLSMRRTAELLTRMGLGSSDDVTAYIRQGLVEIRSMISCQHPLCLDYIAECRKWPSPKDQADFQVPVAEHFWIAQHRVVSAIKNMEANPKLPQVLPVLIELAVILPKAYRTKDAHFIGEEAVFGHMCVMLVDMKRKTAFLFDPIKSGDIGAMQRATMSVLHNLLGKFTASWSIELAPTCHGPQPGNLKECKQCDAYCLMFVEMYMIGWSPGEIEAFWKYKSRTYSKKTKVLMYENWLMHGFNEDSVQSYEEKEEPEKNIAAEFMAKQCFAAFKREEEEDAENVGYSGLPILPGVRAAQVQLSPDPRASKKKKALSPGDYCIENYRLFGADHQLKIAKAMSIVEQTILDANAVLNAEK